MVRTQLPLPSNRAFVVKFYADAQVEKGQFYGRVEHVISYQSTRFQSLDELVAFMTRILTAQERKEVESLEGED